MKRDIFDIIVCSADPIIAEAFKSIIVAINCRPVLLKDYSEIKNTVFKSAKAVLTDELVLHKDKITYFKNVSKKYELEIPVICLIESLSDIKESLALIQFHQKPIDAITLNNILTPFLDSGNKEKTSSLIKIGKYNFNKSLNILTDENNNITTLTNLESKLLLILFQNLNQTLSEEYLLKTIWGYSSSANSNTIKTHIWRLRKKIIYNTDIMLELENINNGYVLKINKKYD
jgi:two-component system, OmpR family, response regulator MtrA